MRRIAVHPWSAPSPGRPVVLGVHPDQDASTVRKAAQIARGLSTGLVCVWVDPAHVLIAREPDGSLDVTPTDPDHVDEDDEVGPAGAPDDPAPTGRGPDDRLAGWLADLLDPTGVPWRFVHTVGEPTHGLRGVAAEYDAVLIAVGARRGGLGAWMNELIGGSVAGRLAHTQHRPVLVVPPPRPGEPDDGAPALGGGA